MIRTMLVALRGRTLTTGRFLAQALDVELVHSPIRDSCDLLIRWGNSAITIPHSYVVNAREGVSAAARKDKALWLMKQEGVRVPNFLPIKSDSEVESLESCIPGFLRGRYHQRGSRLQYVANPDDCREALKKGIYDYIVQEIHKIQEWRIHVGEFMGAELLYIQRKLRQPDVELVKVWNFENGWTFNTRSVSSIANYVMIDEAKRAVQALGLNFGAVDILIDEGGEPWVIEVNTAPALLVTPSQGSYIKYFKEVIANVSDCLYPQSK